MRTPTPTPMSFGFITIALTLAFLPLLFAYERYHAWKVRRS